MWQRITENLLPTLAVLFLMYAMLTVLILLVDSDFKAAWHEFKRRRKHKRINNVRKRVK